MTHPWVMDNKCVKYYPDPFWQWGVTVRTQISSSVNLHCDLDLGDMTLSQGQDTPLGQQQLCEISRSNLEVRSYGLYMDFRYVNTVTLI